MTGEPGMSVALPRRLAFGDGYQERALSETTLEEDWKHG